MSKTSSRKKTFKKLSSQTIPNGSVLNETLLVGIAFKGGQMVRDPKVRLSECDGLLEGHATVNKDSGKLQVYQPPLDGFWIPIPA